MAEVVTDRTSSLAEDYLLKGKEEKQDVPVKPVEVKEAENPVSATQEVVSEKAADAPAAVAEESSEVASSPAAEESTESSAALPEDKSSENAPAAAEESSEENSGDQEAAEETRELRLETAPADFRFPTTNQTRHCFTRYIEYHRCIAAKGEDAPECDKFSKYYRALCPGEWVDRWNEQRENGTFPGPL